jgi:uncharacterized protein YgbK (DUF1537 family)
MLAVIADDITGAAEIAGTGLRFGLKVSLVTRPPEALPESDLLVYATDTRSMSEDEAVNTTKETVGKLLKLGCSRFFKKTDSALRGHPVAELNAFMTETALKKTILIPQNPSRGRVIRNGVYLINETPINETSFADDPEFPVFTSAVKDFLKDVTVVNSAAEIHNQGIFIANASDDEDIRPYLRPADNNTLLAGGADFFIEYLRSQGHTIKPAPDFEGLSNKNVIVLCGSTANHALREFDYFRRNAVRFHDMPGDVFDGADPRTWIETVNNTYSEDKSVVVSIHHPSKGGKAYAVRLRNTMAAVAAQLVQNVEPQELLIEGGATAFAVLRRLGWSSFRVTNEIMPGVVRMSLTDNPNIHITLKPGSYDWGNRIFV